MCGYPQLFIGHNPPFHWVWIGEICAHLISIPYPVLIPFQVYKQGLGQAQCILPGSVTRWGQGASGTAAVCINPPPQCPFANKVGPRNRHDASGSGRMVLLPVFLFLFINNVSYQQYDLTIPSYSLLWKPLCYPPSLIFHFHVLFPRSKMPPSLFTALAKTHPAAISSGLFGRASAPPKIALAPMKEQLQSRCFGKPFDKNNLSWQIRRLEYL